MEVLVTDVTNWQQESRPVEGGQGHDLQPFPLFFSVQTDRASNHRLCDVANTCPLIGCLYFTALPLLIERLLYEAWGGRKG